LEDKEGSHLGYNSSGVYICKSVVNDLRHGNFVCESEVIYQMLNVQVFEQQIPVEFTNVNQ
jgi:hypothetical protein